MKLKLNKACDISSISVLPPRRSGGGGGGMSAPAASAAAAQQRSQSMSQKSFSQGGGSFSQGIGSVGASFSQGRGGGGASFSQGSGGAAFSQVGGGGGAAFSQAGGGGGAAFSQDGGAAFSQGGGNGGAAFSQSGGGGGASFSQGGGSASFVHAQSQLSQASPDENLLSLHHPSPARGDQRFTLQDDSSKRMPSFPANSASCVRDESQLQLAKIPSHRWNPSLPDTRCQINEEVERKFQHLASSVHKMGMVLDSVQNDVMQLNRGMKEASLDSGSIQKKFVLLEDSLQQILKGQDDLKALLEGSAKGNPEHLNALNSHSSKLDEISSIVSVLPKQVQAELMQLKGDIFRIFTKEMEGVVRAIRSLNSSGLGAMQTLATPLAHGSPLMNQTPVVDGSPLMSQGPLVDGRPQRNQTHTVNARPQRNQTAAAKGRPKRNQTQTENGKPQRKKQAAVAKGRPQRNQRPVANARPQRKKQAQTENGRPQMNQKPEANGKALMNQVLPITKVVPAPLVYHRKPESSVKAKAEEEGNKLGGSSSCSRTAPAPKQQQALVVSTQKAMNKGMLSNVIDLDADEEGGGSDSDSEGGGSSSCVILEMVTTGGGEDDAAEILRRARKRRRREGWGAIVLLRDQQQEAAT